MFIPVQSSTPIVIVALGIDTRVKTAGHELGVDSPPLHAGAHRRFHKLTEAFSVAARMRPPHEMRAQPGAMEALRFS